MIMSLDPHDIISMIESPEAFEVLAMLVTSDDKSMTQEGLEEELVWHVYDKSTAEEFTRRLKDPKFGPMARRVLKRAEARRKENEGRGHVNQSLRNGELRQV